MSTTQELIRRFLNHDGVNNAWVAQQLYGERSTSNTSRLRKKHLGVEGRSFTDDELAKLDQIRRKFIGDLI